MNNKIIILKLALILLILNPCKLYAQTDFTVSDEIINNIESEIEALFNDSYIVVAYNIESLNKVNSVCVDKSITSNNDFDSGEYIFLANSLRQNDGSYPLSFIGIYDTNSSGIVWYSDRIINSITSSSVDLFAICDINNDEKVEIITSWAINMIGTHIHLWIFSWDGTRGIPLNQITEKGYSNIKLMNGTFEFVDFQLNQIKEIRGQDINQQTVVYSWDGSNYTINEIALPNVLPRDGASVKVVALVQKEDNILQYRYEVTNESTNVQPLEEFSLKNYSSKPNGIDSPEYWEFNPQLKDQLISWQVKLFLEQHPTALLYPGHTYANFIYESEGLPRSITFYAKGNNGFINNSTEELLVNSYTGTTLGPWLPDSSMSLQDFTDTLETFRYRSCEELDWVNESVVCNQLEQQVVDVGDFLSAQDTLQAANALQDFIDLVEAEKDISLTSEGYALLYFNAEYLAERLPEPQEPNTGSGITCGCDNPVTQSSGTITIENGDTRCLNTTFSGSVFFQSGGTLNVCSVANLQNVYGNQPGHINVSETGEVSVGNWNNNFSEDAFTNWGTTTFSNWTTINNGALTNHGTMTVGGGLNQNNGTLSNSGTLSVNRSVNLNSDGVQNTGYWSIGQSLTLNSNAEVINECRVEVGNQLMINGVLESAPGSFVSAGGQLTINSGGRLSLGGNQAMATFNGVMLNGTIESTGANLMVTGNTFNFNSGAAITTGGEPLYLVAPNLSNVSASFNVADGSALVLPATACNPQGYNDPEN